MLRNRQSTGGLPSHGGSYGSDTGGSNYGGYSGGGGSSNGYGGYGNTGYSNGSSDSKYAPKRRSSSLPGAAGFNPLAIGCAILGFWAVIMTGLNWSKSSQLNAIFKEAGRARNMNEVMAYMEAERRRSQMARQEAKDKMRDHTDQHSSKVNLLHDQIKTLQQHKDTLIDKHESDEAVESREMMTLRELAFEEQIEILQAGIRKEAHRAVKERYGPGPHKVRFTYRFPNEDGTYQPEESFVVQTAPLDLVPHAIHLFLQQVEHGLWNHDAYAYLNGPHVLQIGPQMFDEDDEHIVDESQEHHRIEHFEDMELDELMFPDYHEEFPHVEWTLGFTGRPGGPDFYLNKVDNSESHGPGGQQQFVLDEQADACFAKVIEGKDKVQKLYNAKAYTDDEWGWIVIEPVPIVRAEILTKKPPRKPLAVNNAETQHHQQPLHQQFQQQQQQHQYQDSNQQQQQYQDPNQQQQQYQDPNQRQQQQREPELHQHRGRHARLPPEKNRVEA